MEVSDEREVPQRDSPDSPATAGPRREGSQASEKPVYRKPRLHRYDQIEQVKPYGPSERRAG